MRRYRHGREGDREGPGSGPPPLDGSLARLATGQRAIVHTIEGGPAIVTRLAALGIVPGTPVRVMSNSTFGPLIVEARGSRLALGRREAGRIMVEAGAE